MNKTQYIEQLKSKLDQWNGEIDRLEAQAELTKADIKTDVQGKIGELKAKRNKINEHINQLQDASEDAWEDIKTGADQAVNTLTETFKSVSAQFK
ncbi:MAG: hypothetical protein RQ715_11730 [Methylococcales bacterium]|nr:hypothetical protein [Methylococcales bacterium]